MQRVGRLASRIPRQGYTPSYTRPSWLVVLLLPKRPEIALSLTHRASRANETSRSAHSRISNPVRLPRG